MGSHYLLQGIFLIEGQTWVSHIAGRFFTVWATRESLKQKIKSWSLDLEGFHHNQDSDSYCYTSVKHQPVSVQFSHSVMSDSLWPNESQHVRPPCPSPTFGVHWNSCPLSQWCHPAISSSVVPFSRLVYKHKRSQIVKAILKKNSTRHIHSLISDYSTKL